MMRLSLWILFLVPTLGIAAEHSYGGRVLATDIASVHKMAVYSSVGRALYVRRDPGSRPSTIIPKQSRSRIGHWIRSLSSA